MTDDDTNAMLDRMAREAVRRGGECRRPCPAPAPDGQPCTRCMTPGGCLPAEDAFMPIPGRGTYQVRVDFPGGGIMLAGASSWSRNRVREDFAGLTGQPETRVHVTRKIRPPHRRRAR